MLARNIRRTVPLIVFCALCTPAFALTMQDFGYDPFHQRLAQDRQAVGLLEFATPEGLFTCSGTLIDEEWVLTAAHCVAEMIAGDFIVSGQRVSAESWYAPDTFTPGPFNIVASWSDVGLIKLNTPVQNPTTMQYNRRDANYINPIGKVYEHVGFGTYGTGHTGNIFFDGENRAGHNKFNNSNDGFFNAGDFGYPILVSDFDLDPGASEFGDAWNRLIAELNDRGFEWGLEGPLVLESLTASGDSGGPDIIDGKIVGVHSFGLTLFGDDPISEFFEYSGSVDVTVWADWIDAVLANGAAATADIDLFGDEDFLINIGVLSASEATSPLLDEGEFDSLLLQYENQMRALIAAKGIDITSDLAPTDAYSFFGGPGPSLESIPEPTSLLVLTGIGMALSFKRRRKTHR